MDGPIVRRWTVSFTVALMLCMAAGADAADAEPVRLRPYPTLDPEPKWGYLNERGITVIQPRFDSAAEFSEGLAFASEGTWCGWIDAEGRAVFEAPEGCDRDGYFHFSEGLAAFSVKGDWGFIDKEGRQVIEPVYCGASLFREGLARVQIGENRTVTETAFIDKTGKVVISLKNKTGGPCHFASDFSNGLAAVEIYYLKPGAPGPSRKTSGFIDKTGHFAIEPTWRDVCSFSEGLAAMRDDAPETTKFIDSSGKVVGAVHGGASKFSEGLAAVRVGDHWGFIDKQMKFVVHPDEYEGKRPGPLNEVTEFTHGLALVHIGGEYNAGWGNGWLGGAWYFMNRKGQTVRHLGDDRNPIRFVE